MGAFLVGDIQELQGEFLIEMSLVDRYGDMCAWLFRLNEGHTVYLERRIGGRLFGEQFRQFHALGGWRELQNTVRGCSQREVTLIQF